MSSGNTLLLTPAPSAPAAPAPPLPATASQLDDEPSSWHSVGSVAAYVLANLAATTLSGEQEAQP